MIEVGRVCLKIAGRDSNLVCVVVEVVDDKTVLIDGQTRRRNCNIIHLEPTSKLVNIKKGASHTEVVKALDGEGIKVEEKKKSTKAKTPKPVKQRKSNAKLAKKAEPKPNKKVAKKK